MEHQISSLSKKHAGATVRKGNEGRNADTRLRALVDQHRGSFPWYDVMLSRVCLSSDSLLTELPIIDDEILDNWYYRAENRKLSGASTYLTSGTSTGARKRVLWSPSDHSQYVSQRASVFKFFLRNIAKGSVVVSDLGTGHAAASAKFIFHELGFDAKDLDFSLAIEKHVTALNDWQPAVLFTMPMILDQILATGSASFRPKKIVVVGDIASLSWRMNIAARFGIKIGDILDIVGSIDVGAIAYLDEETGLYRFHDHILPEVISPEGRDSNASANDRDGLLVLTSFARSYFPALRYQTNDIVRGFKTVELDGQLIETFECITGRYSGDLKHGERISSYDLSSAVTDVLGVVLFDVSSVGGLEIRIAVSELTSTQKENIVFRLLERCPDVKQMINSGLVSPIRITKVRNEDVISTRGKRHFSWRES